VCPEHHVHGFLEVGNCLRLQRTDLNHSSVVDEDVDLSEMLDHFPHHVLNIFLRRDVASDGENLHTFLAKFACGDIELLLIASADRHAAALPREFLGKCETKSARSSRDEHAVAADVGHRELVPYGASAHCNSNSSRYGGESSSGSEPRCAEHDLSGREIPGSSAGG